MISFSTAKHYLYDCAVLQHFSFEHISGCSVVAAEPTLPAGLPDHPLSSRSSGPHICWRFIMCSQRLSLRCLFISVLLIFCNLLILSHATLTVPGFFSSNMVMQRAPQSAHIWGSCDSSAANPVTITVKLIMAEGGVLQTKTANVASDGNWTVTLDPVPTRVKPCNISITSSRNEVVLLTNVVFGDVVLLIGQSNMELSLSSTNDSKTYIAETTQFSQLIRMTSPAIQWCGQFGWAWHPVQPSYTKCESAVGYHYARQLSLHFQEKGSPVPFGLISFPKGGCCIDNFMSPESIQSCLPYKIAQGCLDKTSMDFYIKYLKDLTGLSISTVLWYQGESNPGDPAYNCWQSALIRQLRTQFNNPRLPFYAVELSSWKSGGNYRFFALTQRNVSANGYARSVQSFDYGNWTNVHPIFKKEVAERLALVARTDYYGEKDVLSKDPELLAITHVRNSTHVTYSLVFDHMITYRSTTNHLPWNMNMSQYDGCLERQHPDKKFIDILSASQAVLARIDGPDVTVHDNTLSFSVPLAQTPWYIRYAWFTAPSCAIYSRSSYALVVAPFVVSANYSRYPTECAAVSCASDRVCVRGVCEAIKGAGADFSTPAKDDGDGVSTGTVIIVAVVCVVAVVAIGLGGYFLYKCWWSKTESDTQKVIKNMRKPSNLPPSAVRQSSKSTKFGPTVAVGEPGEQSRNLGGDASTPQSPAASMRSPHHHHWATGSSPHPFV